MLRKMIRHEWKSTYRMCGLMILLVAGVTLLGVLGFALPFHVNLPGTDHSMATVIKVMVMTISMIVYIVMLIGATYGMTIWLGIHFYRTMYSDEGYLTQTLPVSARQLIVSKTLVAGIWNMLLSLSVMLSIGILAFSLMGLSIGTDMLWTVWNEIIREFDKLVGLVSPEVIHVLVSLLIMCLLSPFSAVLILFGSLTIGQLSNKYKAMMGILAYFGVLFAQTVLNYIIQFIASLSGAFILSFTEGESMAMGVTYDGSILLMLIMGGAMYFIMHYILTKRLNMD